MHDGKISTIERSVQLAKSGKCATIDEIREALSREGYEAVHPHLAGLSTKKKLRALIEVARAPIALSDTI